ncbi:hypothetical protein MBLNU230_g2670t1 [Neophaeotheca triangularis]
MSHPYSSDLSAPTGPAAMNGSPARPNNNNNSNKGQRTPSAAQQQQGQTKPRNNRKKPNQSFSQGQPDYSGSMSDSVTNPQSSRQTPAKQRQSVPYNSAQQIGQNMPSAQKNNRPASMGGSMLPTTPAKEQAYAGPTFQASPAASSLPMPKFFSKSVPNAAPQGTQPSLAGRMEGEKTPEQKVSPGPDHVSPSGVQQQSPLDMFFKADKAEKDRKRSQAGGMLSPENATRAPPATEPRNPFAQNGRSVFLSELDGDSDNAPSPKTVGPKETRPSQSRAQSSPGQVPQVDGARNIEEEKEAMTRSLKAMLMTGDAPASPTQTPPPQQPQQSSHRAQNLGQPFGTPSPPTTRPNPAGPPSSEAQSQHYALQYGNKNLSPLFRSTRTGGNGNGLDSQTPSRPSSLRQEVDNTPSSNSIPFPAFANIGGASGMSPRVSNASGQGHGYASPQQAHQPQPQSQQPYQQHHSQRFPSQQGPQQNRQSGHMDPYIFSRQFLDQSVRDSGPPPQLPFSHPQQQPHQQPQQQPLQSYSNQISESTAPSQHTNGSAPGKDVSAMEDSLRRMLKLNGTS